MVCPRQKVRPFARILLAAAALAVCSTVYAQEAPTTQPLTENGVATKEKQPSALTPAAPATPEAGLGPAFSFSGGADFSSHFISFGADVWGGRGNASPFAKESVVFVHGTVTAQVTDSLSAYVNVWSDLNDNVDSPLGGPIQEIDLNGGVKYNIDKFTVGAAYAYWQFAGGAEEAIEGSLTYNDKDLIAPGFALNPAFLVHYRYDTTGALHEHNAAVLQFGIAPSYTFLEKTSYPVSIALPMNVGYFTDPYHGGSGAGVGYLDAGVSATIPLSFVPQRLGSWNVTLSELFYHTANKEIPGNVTDNFAVSTLSIGFSF